MASVPRPGSLLSALLFGAIIATAACGGNAADEAASTPTRPGRAGTPVTSAYTASGPLAIGDGEGALAQTELSPPPDPESSAGARRFTLPVDRPADVLDTFGAPRGSGRVHGGIDLGASADANIRSVCSGKVIESGVSDANGEHVTVDCGGGWTALLGYLGKRNVETGATVTSSTVVGRADTVLRFVHVELRFEGKAVDPQLFLPIAPPATAAPPSPTRPAGGQGEPAATATPATAPTEATLAPTNTTAVSPSPTRAVATATATPRPPTSTPLPRTATPTPTAKPIVR